MVTLNTKSEVADFLDVSQFLPGRSAYECVAYCGALVKYCGPPDKGATGSTLQASNLAQYWYGKEEGSTLASNTNGMSLDAMYNMLAGMGLKYQALSSVQDIKDTLAQQGYPVLLCGAETGMVDMGLGESVPYSWTPTGNHCILVSGVVSDGNLLVHDCASIGPSGVRPGPRIYDASKISLVSATAVIPAWKGTAMLPSGWSDDGHTLHTPGADIVLGFRAHVLPRLLSGQWEASDYPDKPQYYVTKLEASNPDLGDGDQLATRKHLLGYPHNPTGAVAGLKNTVIEEYVGTELDYLRIQYAALYGAYQKLKAQPAPVPTPAPDTQMQTQLTQVQQELADASAKVGKLTALAQEMILESVA